MRLLEKRSISETIKCLLIFIISFPISIQTFGQTFEYRIENTNESINVDGLLDEDIWSQAKEIVNFTQNWPKDSIQSDDRTVVRLVADDQYLYLSAKCYIKENEKFVVNTLYRDFDIFRNDSFILLLDTYADGLNGFSFEVTPFGSQGERLISNGGVNFEDYDYNWENKWRSAVIRTENQWVVEMAIPFKSLRFNSDIKTWKANFIRNNLSANRRSSWYPIPVNMNIINLRYTGSLIWDQPLKAEKINFSFIPSFTSTFFKNYDNTSSWEQEYTPSLDLKLGFGSSLNMDLTVNPDFSQIEVDQQQLNISRFELFFPEKRQFFQENSDIFANFGNSNVRPFFSRRIGIMSDLSGEFQSVPILGGLRLSGKTSSKSRIGIMNIVSGESKIMDSQSDSIITINGNNYFAGAYQHQVLERSTVSLLFMDRRSTSYKWNENYNGVIGGQLEWVSKNNSWNGDAFYFHDIHKDSNDLSYGVSLGKSSQHFGLFTSFTHIGKEFNPDVGFVPRSGVNRVGFAPFYIFRPKTSKINNIDVFFDSNHTLSHDFRFLDSNIFSGTFIGFANTSSLLFAMNSNYTFLLDDFDPSFSDAEPLPKESEFFYPSLRARYRSDQRKFFSGSLQLEYGKFFNGTKFTMTSTGTLRWQPYLEFGVDFIYNDITLEKPNGNNEIYLIRPQARISINKNMFITYVSQYNSLQESLSNNIRIQWRFKSASDLFIVYTDNYSENFTIQNRGISLKIIYWL